MIIFDLSQVTLVESGTSLEFFSCQGTMRFCTEEDAQFVVMKFLNREKRVSVRPLWGLAGVSRRGATKRGAWESSTASALADYWLKGVLHVVLRNLDKPHLHMAQSRESDRACLLVLTLMNCMIKGKIGNLCALVSFFVKWRSPQLSQSCCED